MPSLVRFLLLLGFCTLIAAEIADQSNAILPRHEDGEGEKIQCRTPRASNYYGIGVRVGIYFTQVQAFIANNFLSREIASSADRNTMFLIALSVAMIKCSITGMVEQLDGLLLLHMCGGTMFSVLTIWGYRTQRYAREGTGAIKWFGGFGTHSRLIISTIISGYGVFYWTLGITGALDPMGPHDDPPNPEECAELFTFMFSKVYADGAIRYFYIAWWGFWTLYFATMLLFSSLAGYVKVVLVSRLVKARDWAGPSRLKFESGFTANEHAYVFRYIRWINAFWLVYSIVAVEFTLNFNHVSSVLGGSNSQIHLPTQLLPLLIGVFGFIRVCWLKVKELRSFDAPTTQHPYDGNSSLDSGKTIRNSASVLQLFSPALATYSPPEYKIDHPAEPKKEPARRSTMTRYLIAWLPWLSLLRQVRGGDKGSNDSDSEKRGMMSAVPYGRKRTERDMEDDSSVKGLMVPDGMQRYGTDYRPHHNSSGRRDSVDSLSPPRESPRRHGVRKD